MSLSPRTCLALLAALTAGATSWSQISPPLQPNQGGKTGTPPPSAAPPATIAGYVVTMDVKAVMPGLRPSPAAPADAKALTEKLKTPSTLQSRLWLTQDFSRQEILSTDFVLPAGTVVLHKAGERSYFILYPKDKTYVMMDGDALLDALEGGAGVVNRQYEVKVEHTGEKKTIAGLQCRQSNVIVTYVSSIPVENDRVLVQQKNVLDVWHTSSLVSSAATDHFFFKYQRDKTGAVQRILAAEVGFPMEVNLTVTQGTGKKGQAPQPGSVKTLVSEVKQDKELDASLFRIPPAGYRRLERAPYFAAGAQASPVQ